MIFETILLIQGFEKIVIIFQQFLWCAHSLRKREIPAFENVHMAIYVRGKNGVRNDFSPLSSCTELHDNLFLGVFSLFFFHKFVCFNIIFGTFFSIKTHFNNNFRKIIE